MSLFHLHFSRILLLNIEFKVGIPLSSTFKMLSYCFLASKEKLVVILIFVSVVHGIRPLSLPPLFCLLSRLFIFGFYQFDYDVVFFIFRCGYLYIYPDWDRLKLEFGVFHHSSELWGYFFFQIFLLSQLLFFPLGSQLNVF